MRRNAEEDAGEGAGAPGKRVDIDNPRHNGLIAECRQAGALMCWLEHHQISETLAESAQAALNDGRRRDALRLYADAARAEEAALAALDPSKARTLGLTAVSAAALYYKAAEYKRFAEIAQKWLTAESLPAFAREQLRDALRAAARSAANAAPPNGTATNDRAVERRDSDRCVARARRG